MGFASALPILAYHSYPSTRYPRMIPFSVLDLAPIRRGGDAAQAFRNSLDLAQHAEKWGFKRFWLAEHHNMPGIASAATSVVIGHVAGGTKTIRVGSGGDHAAEPLAAGDRRAVRHAGIALSRAHRSRARPRAGHRPAHRAGDAARPCDGCRKLSAGRAGTAGAARRRAAGPGDPRRARHGDEGAALDPRLEHVRRAARGRCSGCRSRSPRISRRR